MGKDDITQYLIECLRKDIEKEVGRSISTSSDFDFLSLKLKDGIPDAPSISTLKRLWAYVSDSSARSKSTLNSLSRFLGYNDWNNYVENLMRDNRVESGFLNASSIATEDIRPGDRVEFTWNPGRRVIAQYLGDNRYEVVRSENAKLKEGAIFKTMIITKGLPLYCADVLIGDEKHDDYVAGTKSGITSLRYLPGKS